MRKNPKSLTRIASRTAGIFLALCLGLALAPRAFAHAVLLRSTPAAGSTVNAGTIQATLKYDSRVAPKGSSLSLMAPDGEVTELTIEHQPAPDALTTTLKATSPGKYFLRWQVLSSDGHITRGQIPFEVR